LRSTNSSYPMPNESILVVKCVTRVGW
jgi:hypothetical protein